MTELCTVDQRPDSLPGKAHPLNPHNRLPRKPLPGDGTGSVCPVLLTV